MPSFKKISTLDELQKAFKIREEVFVVEQEVDKELEYDEFEQSSVHYLALGEDLQPVGTSRWRFTENGIKMERFAILKESRGKNYGKGLMDIMKMEIKEHPDSVNKDIYLHAQVQVIPFYEKFGFQAEQEIFEEAGILHKKMYLKDNQ